MTQHDDTTQDESTKPVDETAAEQAAEATTPEVRHSTVNAAFVARLKAALAA